MGVVYSTDDEVLGYNLNSLFETLFGETSSHTTAMAREFRTFLLMAAEKSRKRLDTDLFRQYLNALAKSPKVWFRLRDCDALARYTAASALACNDFNTICFNEPQWEALAELSCTLYDAVAFYKHRAEGETNNTFAYAGNEMRIEAFRVAREVLWALDTEWTRDPAKRCVVNFARFFGGPIHMTTRRYRFVEDGLMIGKPETEKVVELTRQNFKLWNRAEVSEKTNGTTKSFVAVARQANDDFLLAGFTALLQGSAKKHCKRCSYPAIRSNTIGQFGSVRLCDWCKDEWASYTLASPLRFATAFPELSHCFTLPERTVNSKKRKAEKSSLEIRSHK